MKFNVRVSKHHILVVVVSLLVLIGFIGAVIWINASENNGSTVPSGNESVPTVSTGTQEETGAVFYVGGKAVRLKENVETVLFLGLDKYLEDSESDVHINNQQADTLMLAVFDHDSKEVSLLPINRDTMTEVDTYSVTGDFSGSETMQIALSHAYGTGEKNSCENTVKAVWNLLYNVPIDHYASLKMDAVPYLNDVVGGVTLTLKEDFTTLDPSFTKGTTVNLSGAQALTYIRSRQDTEEQTNTSRMERQNQYIDSWAERFTEAYAANDALVVDMFYELSPYMYTDLSVNELDEMAVCLQTYQKNPVLHIEGESKIVNNFMEFHVDSSALEQLVCDLFFVPVEQN